MMIEGFYMLAGVIIMTAIVARIHRRMAARRGGTVDPAPFESDWMNIPFDELERDANDTRQG